MTAYQLTIPAENKPGTLSRITSILSQNKINMRAITITSFGDNGFFHLIVDDPKKARDSLKAQGINVELKEVIAVLIDDKPGSLDKLIQLLYQKNINVENAYGFVLESRKKAVFVVDVNKIDDTQIILKEAGYKTLDPDSLNDIDDY